MQPGGVPADNCPNHVHPWYCSAENGMSIGGPSGIGGPKGPTGPADVGDVDEVGGEHGIEQAVATGRSSDIDALSAQIAAGTLTKQEAIDKLVETTATPDMDATERAELRELLTDLVANDPYLGGLANRV
jgi:hypothetical protein